MRKTREEKAITLIALIITIVVLLILAVVAINAVTGDGIIQHATNARDSYENAQAKEQSILSYYESYLQTEGQVGKWTQDGSTLKSANADGTVTEVKIGDYVSYNEGSYTHTPDVSKGAGTSNSGGELEPVELETEDLTWRVLGVNEKGELELISTNPTSENQKLYLANDEGYVNAVESLNDFCNNLYGQGKNSEGKKVATGARSLNVDDINKLTEYNSTSDGSYGNKWTYKYPTDAEVSASTTGLTNNIWYKTISADGTLVTDWTNITRLDYKTFRLPEETTAISSTNSGSKEVTHTSYSYSIPENGYTSEEATEIANIIIKGTENENITQWLASRVVYCQTWRVRFGVRLINDGSVNNNFLFNSYDEDSECHGYRVRPIVSLSSEVSLTGTGDNVGTSTNMWKIS